MHIYVLMYVCMYALVSWFDNVKSISYFWSLSPSSFSYSATQQFRLSYMAMFWGDGPLPITLRHLFAVMVKQ